MSGRRHYASAGVAVIAPALIVASAATRAGPRPRPRAAEDQPVYLVYYWRARPAKLADYVEYIRKVAEPIDEEARKAGVFVTVRTYTPALLTGAPGADWTHMRVFELRNFAALDGFGAGMDAATRRLYPDERTRPRADELRDLVRQEIWLDFR